MGSHRVPGFRPSTHGFRFANCWPSQPLFSVGFRNFVRLHVGDACNGLCGGMVFAAVDYFRSDAAPPGGGEPPAHGTPLFAHLRRRLFQSFHLPWGVLRYYRWMASSGRRESLARRTARVTLPGVRREIDAGRLAPLGLVRAHSRNPAELGRNHQVLAYGYDEEGDRVKVWVYDPNYPGCDDVSITLDLARLDAADAFTTSTGEPLRGFFLTRYRPWRRPLPPGGAA